MDNDCNGMVDDGNPGGGAACGVCNQSTITCITGALTCPNPNAGLTTYYRDADSDQYGDPSATTQSCTAPAGYVANNTDCDDTTSARSPSLPESCGDGIDNNCDLAIDEGC